MDETLNMAEFFYGFMPMDDFPVAEGIKELAKSIDELPEDNGTRHGLRTYMESAYHQMRDYKEIYTPGGFDEVVSKFEDPNIDYKYLGKRTKEGTLYLDIARFLLRMSDMGLLFDFDDNTHYNLIGDALETAPANIIYVLSSATENVIQ